MKDVSINEGFSEPERERVAALYWDAFGRKLRPAFADEPTGLTVVRTSLRSAHMLVARECDRVVGVCGFYQAGIGAADLRWSGLRRSLSASAALRASLALLPLWRSDRRDALVLDGICVDRATRGRKVGTYLLSAAAEKARRIGMRAVRLSVVDTNPRARALYERHGFAPIGRGALGPLASVYGFDGYTTMELEVG